jgi:hypothetical protein
MGVSNINLCLFAVFYNPDKQPFVQTINFEPKMWQAMKNSLENFYFNVHIKNIMNHLG